MASRSEFLCSSESTLVCAFGGRAQTCHIFRVGSTRENGCGVELRNGPSFANPGEATRDRALAWTIRDSRSPGVLDVMRQAFKIFVATGLLALGVGLGLNTRAASNEEAETLLAPAPVQAPAGTRAQAPRANRPRTVGPGSRDWSTGRRVALHRPWLRSR